jgi:hypothetical protein
MICLVLVVVAAGLFAAFVEYDHQNITTRNDYSEIRSRPDDPLLVTWWEVADIVCMVDQPCPAIAVAQTRGFFARSGVPVAVAAVAGLILPYLLLWAALFMSLGGLTGKLRRVAAILMIAIGALPVGLFAYLTFRAVAIHDVPIETLVRRLPSDILGVVVLVAVPVLITGLALFARAPAQAEATRPY